MLFAASETSRTIVVDRGGADLLTPAATLLAVVVGGMLAWLAQERFSRRQEKAEAKAGARVLQAELGAAGSRIKDAVNDDRNWYVFYRVELQSWKDFQAILGKMLDNDQWAKVAQSAVGLRELEDGMTKALGPGGPKAGAFSFPLTDKQITYLKITWQEITDAYNALASHADSGELDGLIHADAPSAAEWVVKPPEYERASFQ